MKKLFQLREKMIARIEGITPEEKRNIDNFVIQFFTFAGIILILVLIHQFKK